MNGTLTTARMTKPETARRAHPRLFQRLAGLAVSVTAGLLALGTHDGTAAALLIPFGLWMNFTRQNLFD